MKQNSFYNLKNILIVLDVKTSEVFRELDYSFSKQEIEDLDFYNKSKIIDFNYERIFERLSELLNELSISFTNSFSDENGLSNYLDKINDELFIWLEDYYGHLFDYFDIDYSQDDHVKIFNDTELLIDELKAGLTITKNHKNSNLIHFPIKNSSPMNKLLGNNTNCQFQEESYGSTEDNLNGTTNKNYMTNQRKSLKGSTENASLIDDISGNQLFLTKMSSDLDASVRATEMTVREQAMKLIKSNNEFGYKLWQEKPFDLVAESFLKSWVDDIYYNQSDPDNKKIFTCIKEYFINKSRSETS